MEAERIVAAEEIYTPAPEIAEAANTGDYEAMLEYAKEDLTGFWAEQAGAQAVAVVEARGSS